MAMIREKAKQKKREERPKKETMILERPCGVVAGLFPLVIDTIGPPGPIEGQKQLLGSISYYATFLPTWYIHADARLSTSISKADLSHVGPTSRTRIYE